MPDPIALDEIPVDEPATYDWPALVDSLNRLLRLKTTPVGMKMFATVEDMQAVPKIRRPQAVHTTDQVVAMAARLNQTVGITVDDLVGTQCSAVLGFTPRDDRFLSGKGMAGVWFETLEDSAAHQAAMDLAESGRWQAMAVSPLATARLDPPDICLVYATPGQMIIFINGLQWSGYRKFDGSVVGESSCADSWGRALKTGEPSLSIPCFAERRYGAVNDDELLMALPPKYLPRAIAGMERLAGNGLATPSPSTASSPTPGPASPSATGTADPTKTSTPRPRPRARGAELLVETGEVSPYWPPAALAGSS